VNPRSSIRRGTDPRPLRRPSLAGPFTVAELAEHLGGEVEGDSGVSLVGVRTLVDAGTEHLSFLRGRRYAGQLEDTRAGAVLLDRQTDARGRTAIRCDDPYIAYARAQALFHPIRWPAVGVDPQAWIADDAEVAGATVEAFAWIGPGARVGAGSWIQAGAYVGTGARVGSDCRLMPGSVVLEGCELGNRVWLNPGAVIGGEGFGFAPHPAGHVKVPQVARAVIGDDVEIGANTSVDRGALNDTVIEAGSKLDSQVQIGHGARVGAGSLLAGFVGIAGSSRLGRFSMFGGRSGTSDHVTTGDGVQLGGGSIVFGDQPAGAKLAGYPAIEGGLWRRAVAAFSRLPEMLRRQRRLEKRLARLEAAAEQKSE
jgi:UDP-3-O-[3-hydroxymyristoyl] glucosamine N-acyltransferase